MFRRISHLLRLRCALLALLMLCVSAPAGAFQARNMDKSLGWPGDTLEGGRCQGGGQGPGPADYRDPQFKQLLWNVETHHFQPDVQQLNENVHLNATIQDNLDYTLRAFPNHHRALYALMRYQWRKKSTMGYPPAECYLQRAIAFAPDDGTVKHLYGLFLHKEGHLHEALEQYKAALELQPRSNELHYNVGLLYFDLKQYDEAMHHAAIAYRLGYPLPGLRDMLKDAGHWDASLLSRKE